MAIGGLPACTKYADPPPYFEEIDTLKTSASRKVLIIGVDGFASAAVQKITPAKLTSILQKSKYSWDAVADRPSNSATVWKTLTSGVSSGKHLILDSSFMRQVSGDQEGQFLKAYPSIFNLMLSSAKPDYTSCLISGWTSLASSLLPEIGTKVFANSDLAAKDSLVNRLRKNNTDDINIIEFSDLLKAGMENGFSETSSQYREAVNRLADYLDQILSTLKARPDYNGKEDWLVIVTGTNGGSGYSYDNGTEPERTVPVFYYNEKFKTQEFSSQGLNLGIIASGNSGNYIRARMENEAGASLFNFANTGTYTVQMKFKSNHSGNYTPFLTKSVAAGTGTTNDWVNWVRGDNGYWTLRIAGKTIQTIPPTITDNVWHTLAFSIYDSANSRWVKRFIDGKRLADNNTDRNIGTATAVNGGPLIFGWASVTGLGGVLTCSMMDLALYQTALTDQEIATAACSSFSELPRKDKLAGFWPGNDGFQNKYDNIINPAQSFTILGDFAWTGVPTHCGTRNATPKPNTVQQKFQITDVSRQVFYWLGIDIQKNWGLEGVLWLDKYETEFLK